VLQTVQSKPDSQPSLMESQLINILSGHYDEILLQVFCLGSAQKDDLHLFLNAHLSDDTRCLRVGFLLFNDSIRY
jgi:hypothetical protein